MSLYPLKLRDLLTRMLQTVLSSIVADHLRQEDSSLPPVLCLFIERAHSPNELLGSLVKQLVQLKESGIRTEVRNAWKKETRVNARPSEAVLKGLLAVSESASDPLPNPRIKNQMAGYSK